MKTEQYDVTIELNNWEDHPLATARSQKGEDFLGGARRAFILTSVEDFLNHVPAGLIIGLRNPETNLFAQLPPRSLH